MDKDKFIKDVNDGLTIKQLSIKYNCGTSTVSRLKKKLNCFADVSGRGNTKVSCHECNREFLVNNWRLKIQDNFFCSRSCHIGNNNRRRIGEKHPNWLGSDVTNYRTKALREYGKICSVCGYNKEKCLHVHHIDENRENGEIQNLIVLCPNCHTEVHAGILKLLE